MCHFERKREISVVTNSPDSQDRPCLKACMGFGPSGLAQVNRWVESPRKRVRDVASPSRRWRIAAHRRDADATTGIYHFR